MTADHSDEDTDETLDRNWSELLQELRVVQTGVQLLAGFLLTLPFQQRFQKLTGPERHLYLAVVLLSGFATLVLIAPVPFHRILFRQHDRRVLVTVSNGCALVGSLLLACALVGVNALVFDVVVGGTAAVAVASLVAGAIASLWLVAPVVVRVLANRAKATPGR